jgi:peptide/nickel transport system permease protein
MEASRPTSGAAAGGPLLQLGVRAVLLVAASGAALVAWQALPAPAARAAARAAGAPDFTAGLDWSLGLLAASTSLAAAVGLLAGAVGAAAGAIEPDRPLAATALRAASWLARAPVAALPPAVLALLLGLRLGSGQASAPVEAMLAVAGLPAVLVAAAASEQVGRGAWLAGAAAGLAALGRGLVVAAGALVVVEPIVGAPGLGAVAGAELAGGGGFGPAMRALLLVTLAGALAAALGDALTARWAPPGDDGEAGEPPARAGLWLGVAAMTVPAALLVAALLAPGDATRVDFAALATAPSADHPLGTDGLGRDVLALGLAGLRASVPEALAAAALAAAVGCAWGGAAALVARLGRGAATLADALVAPAWVVALVPLLPAVLLLGAGGGRRLLAPALAVALLARVALAVRDLAGAGAAGPSPALVARAAAGMLLLCAGVAFAADVGLDAARLAQAPAGPTLGRVLAEATAGPGGAGVAASWLCALVAGPCLFAGWTLLRPFRRAQAWARLAG